MRTQTPTPEVHTGSNAVGNLNAGARTLPAIELSDLDQRIRIIQELNLDPIKIKLLSIEDGEGWSMDEIEIVARKYRQFLILNLKYPGKSIVPNKKVDTFWHQHILDTIKYAEDCQVVFGKFLHHFPYFGMRGKDDQQNLQDSYAETQKLFSEEFGESVMGGAATCQVSDCDAEQCSPNVHARSLVRPRLVA